MSPDEKHEKLEALKKAEEHNKGPAGGYDATPLPHRPAGYTVKFTIHKATHLPLADLASLSADPYCKLELKTGLPTRHKEDPPLTFRTQTVWRNTEPEWNQEWIVANIPQSGCRIKARLYDEDSNDNDDRLGNAHIAISGLSEEWKGLQNRPHKVMKRSGSWRAYAIRGLAVCFRHTSHLNGYLYVSAEVLGKTPGNEGGHVYTTGPQYWFKNYSPLLGRLVGNKEPDELELRAQQAQGPAHDDTTADGDQHVNEASTTMANNEKPSDKKNSQRYNFQSNQMQLQGPVPPELYHRYVEFRPFVKGLFTGSGLRGLLLNKALHVQHEKVYNFNKDTKYGVFEKPCSDMTLKFLDLVHWDQGGRIHTYVLTLDGLLRFTETGKEFSIDLLSKHTMHSDASIYIAYSGEFFVRRLKHRNLDPPEAVADGSEAANKTHPPDTIAGGPPTGEPPHDPAYYELIIDNDSGTYRPNGKLLPQLRQFLQRNLPGLKIITLDSQNDTELMQKLKTEQRERKKHEGNRMVFAQISRSSSLSSDDEERLNAVASSQDGGPSGQPKHRLGEAIGPYVAGRKSPCLLNLYLRG